MTARASQAAERLARAIFFAHCEAVNLPFRPWESLTTDERLAYRAGAVEALSFANLHVPETPDEAKRLDLLLAWAKDVARA